MAFEYYNIVLNSTGAITAQLGADTDTDANAVTDNTPALHTAYTGLATDTTEVFYYVGATKTARPAFSTVGSWGTQTITADGVSAATFGSSLPNPTNIIVNVPRGLGLTLPGPLTVTAGSFTLTTTVAGTYEVTLNAFPYVQQSYTITAT